MSDNCKPKTGTREWAQVNVNFLQSSCGKWKCRNNCWYCYAKGMAIRFHQVVGYDFNHQTECGDPRIVMPESLPREKVVMMPSSHDLFPEHLPTICDILGKLLTRSNKVLLVSKPRMDVIGVLIPFLKAFKEGVYCNNVEFRFTIGSKHNDILKRYEPGAPLFEERRECLEYCLNHEFKVSISMEPYLEDPRELIYFIENYWLEGEGPDTIWLGPMGQPIPPELKPLYTKKFMVDLWEEFRNWKNIRFKDRMRRALGIDCQGVTIK